MKKLLYVSFIGILALACTKKNTVRISVKNAATGEPIENADIYITEIFNVSDGVYGSKTEKFYSGNTNSEGILYVPKNFSKHRSYEVFAHPHTGEVCWYNHDSYLATKSNFKESIDFEIAPCAFLKLSIHNVNCQGATDTMILQRNNLSAPSYDGYSTMSFPGCYDYDASDSAKVPSGKWQYKWIVVRNGITTYHDTTFMLNEGECAWIKIYY